MRNTPNYTVVAAILFGFVLAMCVSRPLAMQSARAGVDGQGNLITTVNAQAITVVDASVTITAGGTAQTALAAATASVPRHKLIMSNNTANSAYATYSFTGTAGPLGTPGSHPLYPGQYFTSDADGCPQNAISVYSPTTGTTLAITYG